MTGQVWPQLVLLLLGTGWGLTQSLGKIAVSGGYRGFGVIFWQAACCAVLLGGVTLLRGRRIVIGAGAMRFYVLIALIGTILPNSTYYLSVRHLPAGVMAVMISMAPILTFPVALALGMDRFSPTRAAGLLCGLAGVAMIALPSSSLPGADSFRWVALALVAPAFYAFEGNIVAKWGMAGLDPLQAMTGISAMAAFLVAPLAVLSGQFIDPFHSFGAADWAIAAMAVLQATIYTTYIWLARTAGSVFAAQVAYVVTGTGVLWAMLIFGENYSAWVWGALGLMMVGLTLVRPRIAASQQETCATP